jgi:hypothetical protein
MLISLLTLDVLNLGSVLLKVLVCDEGISSRNKFISNKLHTLRIETFLHIHI